MHELAGALFSNMHEQWSIQYVESCMCNQLHKSEIHMYIEVHVMERGRRGDVQWMEICIGGHVPQIDIYVSDNVQGNRKMHELQNGILRNMDERLAD